jgi:hypothetical protein
MRRRMMESKIHRAVAHVDARYRVIGEADARAAGGTQALSAP